ncbi:hypothetical protein RAS1_00960 [Phycisphaerae bacterium RAS1]|nr:hypothetical protein RAS1_00960 [Phycisphaerae bacterium RAS1]
MKAIAALLCLVTPVCARAQSDLSGSCDSADGWRIISSDGVKAAVNSVELDGGKVLRLDFDFTTGAGFCVLRRELALELPENYRFAFRVRGQCPRNNFEFKLVDPSGDNVWWVNRQNFEFPAEWTPVSYRARHFRFAWGPSGGATLKKLGAIEFAIAAASGGKGSVFFDDLRFETLDPPSRTPAPPALRASSWAPGAAPRETLAESGEIGWSPAANDQTPHLNIDLHSLRELGGLYVDFDGPPKPIAVSLSEDGRAWSAPLIDQTTPVRGYFAAPDLQTRYLRVTIDRGGAPAAAAPTLRTLRLLPVEAGESQNELLSIMARESRRGLFPQYFLGQATPWTVVGAPGDDKEALVDIYGAVEVEKLGWRIEPFLQTPGGLRTWADASISRALMDDYLPIPQISWLIDGLRLEITALAAGPAGSSTLWLRYRVVNESTTEQPVRLTLLMRPFQVLPPWQALNITGGVGRIRSIVAEPPAWRVEGRPIAFSRKPDDCGTTPFRPLGDCAAWIEQFDHLPSGFVGEDRAGLASGAAAFDLPLGPGESRTIIAAAALHGDAMPALATAAENAGDALFEAALRETAEYWRRELSRVRLSLPPPGKKLADTFRTIQAHILINADGPGIQPGSRSYERSWIRDGALTSTALLYTGHAEQVQRFIDWFAPYQFESGKVPCVVDRRGPDPVPEHDSTGQLIYLLLKYYQFTGDREMLVRHLPRVEAGVAYLQSLRAQRMTPEFRDGPPETRVRYGLVTESISHEGYSAKPMHSYWDDFFTLRGFKDAATIAKIVERPDLEQRFAAIRDEFHRCLYDSLTLAIESKKVDYIPGCAELGDFDATSTAVALYPCGEAANLPQPAGRNTFDRYFRFFCDRRDQKTEWKDYTPYEVRLINTFVRLGQPQRAHELADFFLADQSPPEWNQWAEVVHRDHSAPQFIGDMPHTWVGSDFLSAARAMFVYERDADQALVLGAGVRPEWTSTPGVAVEDFPTEYGPVSYKLFGDSASLTLELSTDASPPGGFALVSPFNRPIRAIEVNGAPNEPRDATEARFPTKGHIVLRY